MCNRSVILSMESCLIVVSRWVCLSALRQQNSDPMQYRWRVRKSALLFFKRLWLLTEPRWPLQPRGTQWFLRIGLFVVRAISLGPCRRPIEYLTSSHPCGRLSKIPNSQIHKVKKWKILSNFRRKDFFVISHERKDRFFVVIWPKKTLGHIKYWPKIDLTKVGHF